MPQQALLLAVFALLGHLLQQFLGLVILVLQGISLHNNPVHVRLLVLQQLS